jgi:hypothetical protein
MHGLILKKATPHRQAPKSNTPAQRGPRNNLVLIVCAVPIVVVPLLLFPIFKAEAGVDVSGGGRRATPTASEQRPGKSVAGRYFRRACPTIHSPSRPSLPCVYPSHPRNPRFNFLPFGIKEEELSQKIAKEAKVFGL